MVMFCGKAVGVVEREQTGWPEQQGWQTVDMDRPAIESTLKKWNISLGVSGIVNDKWHAPVRSFRRAWRTC